MLHKTAAGPAQCDSAGQTDFHPRLYLDMNPQGLVCR